MRYLSLLFLSFFIFGFSQTKREQRLEIQKFQKELNKQYQTKETSPLRSPNFESFKKHPFFPINFDYIVKATIERTPNAEAFELPTSSGKNKTYKKFGIATFTIKGKSYQLSLYQSMDLINNPKYKNYLFLPFRDLTNGSSTYGGGKYLDLEIPQDDSMVINFNLSYHPYCAYNAYDYSCPIVPEENNLPIEIKAGVKYNDVYFDK